MKITIFTSNKPRHNFLINELSKISSKIFVIQEIDTIFPGLLNSNYKKSKILANYFNKVIVSQDKIFGRQNISIKNNGLYIAIKKGDLNYCSLSQISEFLNSDIYIVFGSSFIKGDLIKFLIKKKAINIHMGISPYYRGSDCNFWALFDNNYNLVGSTIHYISEELDSGPILYHAVSESTENIFDYSMLSVKSAIISLKQNISNKKIFSYKPIVADLTKTIKYTKSIEFDEEVIKKFYRKKIIKKKIQTELLKNSFVLKSKYFFTKT